MNGVIIVDKPPGLTSHDVVDQVRRVLHTRKVGHGGTLDPDATGVLILGIGKATRFLSYAQQSPKRYAATASFGVTTTTQDASGDVVKTRPAEVDAADVEHCLKELTGDLEQIPPMVSAVKIGGERLYKKARRGEDIERPPRRVTVYELAMTAFRPGDHPQADLDVRCSAGTYVRTLVHDLGEKLGCGAHLLRLCRTEAGGAGLARATPLAEVTPAGLLPVRTCVAHLHPVELSPIAAGMVGSGRPLDSETVDVEEVDDGELAALIFENELAAVYRRRGDALIAERVMPQ